MTNRIFYIILLLLPLTIVQALDVKDFTFSHIGVHEGILNQRVYSLMKTSDGAVWWTTKRDVGRINGVTVSNYRLANRETYASFAGRIVKFASYTSNTLQDSVFVFDNTGKVYHYKKSQNNFEQRYDLRQYFGRDVEVEDVMATDQGLFFATHTSLYYVGQNQSTPLAVLKGLFFNAIIPLKDVNNNIYKNTVLFATNKGLLLATLGAGKTLNNKRFIYSGYVESGYYDNQTGVLWIGTLDSGVKVLGDGIEGIVNSPNTQHLPWMDVAGVPHNPVRDITAYDNTILLGVDGHGVYQCDRKGNTAAVLFNANEGRLGVLHGNGVYSILVGAWNNIFVGTYSGGIDIARPVGSTTAIFKHVVNSDQSISNDHVNCVAQADASHLLMGTDNGLSIFDSENSHWTNTTHGLVVLDICKIPRPLREGQGGSLLLATYGNGVCEVGTDGKAQSIYNKSNGTLQDDHVYSLLYDKKGNLWIGSLFGRLAEKTPAGFRYYDVDNVQALTELHDGRIVVGSAFGLYVVKDGKLQEFSYRVPDSDVVNKFVLDLYEDSNHNLWIATDGGGVYVYNLNTAECFQITRENGLPSNSVSSILRDKTGRIWFGTEKGLAFIYPKNPKRVIDVNYCYGVRTEYVRGAAFNLDKGHMLFGTVDGAIIADPMHLQELNYTAPLKLLRVTCSDVDSNSVYQFNEQVFEMLAEGILKLAYGQRNFELYFESINMRNHFDIAYQYKMDNGEWSEPNENEYIRFVNLESGKHHLTIRCVSESGGAVLDTKELTIIISEPWWNSWWMWIIYLVALVGAFYGAWHIYGLQSRYKKLVMERVTEVGLQKNEINYPKEADAFVEEKLEHIDEVDPDESVKFVNKATKIVLDNLKDTDFTIDTLCREIAMSRTLFYLKVKSYTGKSPQDFVRMIRLERASALLKQGCSVGEVATLTGFDNPKYFSVVFKKHFGISPSQKKHDRD